MPIQHSSVHDLNLEEGGTSARKMEARVWRPWHLEKQWFFKACAMAICEYDPASPGCYSLPFCFVEQLISSAAETLWKSWVQSTESGRRHSRQRRTQLETVMVCMCTCWRCCAVEKCKSCTYAPLNLPVFTAALLQRLFGSCFLRAWKCWGLQEQCRGKNKMSRNSSALGQVRRSCEGGRKFAFQYVGYGPALVFY